MTLDRLIETTTDDVMTLYETGDYKKASTVARIVYAIHRMDSDAVSPVLQVHSKNTIANVIYNIIGIADTMGYKMKDADLALGMIFFDCGIVYVCRANEAIVDGMSTNREVIPLYG